MLEELISGSLREIIKVIYFKKYSECYRAVSRFLLKHFCTYCSNVERISYPKANDTGSRHSMEISWTKFSYVPVVMTSSGKTSERTRVARFLPRAL